MFSLPPNLSSALGIVFSSCETSEGSTIPDSACRNWSKVILRFPAFSDISASVYPVTLANSLTTIINNLTKQAIDDDNVNDINWDEVDELFGEYNPDNVDPTPTPKPTSTSTPTPTDTPTSSSLPS